AHILAALSATYQRTIADGVVGSDPENRPPPSTVPNRRAEIGFPASPVSPGATNYYYTHPRNYGYENCSRRPQQVFPPVAHRYAYDSQHSSQIESPLSSPTYTVRRHCAA